MRGMLVKGWDMTVRHKYVGVLLFLYRLLWGFFLFRLVDSVITPVLARFPDLHPNADAIPLFLIEAEFRLFRTGLLDPLLWLLAALLLARMVVTPLMKAGVYYSFHHTSDEKGTQVLSGIRRSWKPIALLYGAENALVLAPAFWLLPMAKSRFFSEGSLAQWVQMMLPYALMWLVWGFALHLLFQFMSFAAISRQGVGNGLARAYQRALPLLAVSLVMAGMGFAASAVVSAVSVIWSGFIAVIIHQTFHLVRTLLSLWTAASQYAVWRKEQG